MTTLLLFNRTKDDRKKKLCIAQRKVFYYYIEVVHRDRNAPADTVRVRSYTGRHTALHTDSHVKVSDPEKTLDE